MLSNRYQFLKRLVKSHSSKPKGPFQAPFFSLKKTFKFPIYSFSSSQFVGSRRQTNYHDEFTLLTSFSREKLANASHFMDKYTKCEDLSLLTQEDRTEISHVLLHLAFAQKAKGNSDKAYRYLREDEELLHNAGIKDTIHLAQNYHLRADIYMEKNNLVDSEHYLNQIESICKQPSSNSQQAKSLRLQGWCSLAHVYNLKDDQDRALDLFNSILKKISDVQESSLPALLRDVYQGMASIYSSRYDVEKAIDSYLKGLDVATKYHGENSAEAFSIYVDMTTFLYQHGHDEIALRMGQKRLQAAQNAFSKDSTEIASSHLFLGHVETALGDYNKALNSYREALKVFGKTPENHLTFLHDAYFQLVKVYCFIGDYQKALDFLSKADQALVKANSENKLGLAEMYFKWAQEFGELGGLVEESKNYTWKALDLYKSSEPLDKRAILEIYAHLGMTAFGEGDWKKRGNY